MKRKRARSRTKSGAPLVLPLFLLSPTPHLEAQVVPSGVDLARPLHGLALDKVDPQAVAEEPVAFFWEEEGKSGGSRKG